MEISGHTRLLCLIGSPVTHSGSPAMYNYSFEKLGLDYRYLAFDIKEEDIDEIVDIVTEGMLVHWMKPYVYKQENLENSLNTADYSGYSPAELLHRIEEAYSVVKKDFTNRIRSYSYEKGDLTDLHI